MYFFFHFNRTGQLRASQQWLDLLPWSSPALDRERRLLDAGRLAYEMGAYDLVPLQLRLRLHGGEVGKTAVAVFPGAGAGAGGTATAAAAAAAAATAGGMKVIREVLRCNPAAYRHGERGGAAGNVGGSGEGVWMGGGETVFGAGEVGGVLIVLEVLGSGVCFFSVFLCSNVAVGRRRLPSD